jgi:choline dehydrogenase-like flavoprotein
MLLDARTIPSNAVLEADTCIVGAGAAGIALAREFIGSRLKVLLLESGGTEIEADTQDLYRCDDRGDSYPDLTTNRLRFFGGTTNHWGGWCTPLEDIDFEERDWIPYSGWPFDRTHLDPWYRRAQPICQLGRYDYVPANWGIAKSPPAPPFAGPSFVCKMLQVSPPTRFGLFYLKTLTEAPNVTTMLYANALQAEVGDGGRQVKHLAVATLAGGRFTVTARAFVLAAGGVENARLLLLSREAAGGRLGEDHDLIGRFFNTHLEYSGGVIAVSNPYTNFDFNRPYEDTKPALQSLVGLSDQAMRSRKLPGLRLR